MHAFMHSSRYLLSACLVDDGEADVGGWRQAVGEVLHHALQARAGLECSARVVLVLGVDKLRDDALRLLQRCRVAVRLQHQLVDVACMPTPRLRTALSQHPRFTSCMCACVFNGALSYRRGRWLAC